MFKWISEKLVTLYNKSVPNTFKAPQSTEKSQEEARNAKMRAEVDYNVTVANGATVNIVVNKLSDQLERNHFADLIESTIRGQAITEKEERA